MYQNNAVVQNTLHVNDVMIRIFKLLLVVIVVVTILKATGFIALQWVYLTIMIVVGAAICLVPIACRHFRMDAGLIKYVNIYCIAILCTFGYCYLNMGVIVLLAMPIGFACMYFDIKLIRNSAALSIIGLFLGEVSSRMANWGLDTVAQGGQIRTAIYFLEFGIMAALLIAISKSALKILSNTHSFYENINSIFSDIQGSSQRLEAAEGIISQGVSALTSNDEKTEESSSAEEEATGSNAKVRDIISNINKSVENARDLIKYTQTMLKGKGKDLRAEDEIARIEEYGKNTKELISKLSNYTDKIKGDLSLIAIMIDESKLLSLNAAAEAESASSKGRGSTIVAMKVEKLADESADSAIHIQELLNSVVNDAENTVKSVGETYEEIFKSLELINRTVETLIKWLMYKNMN